MYMPYVKDFSEKFKCIGNLYNIRTKFRTTLRCSLMKTRPEGDPQQTAQCVCSIPCECGRSCIGETGRPLVVRLREQRHNLQQSLLEESELAQHDCEEGHRVGWNEAKILQVESYSRYWKYNQNLIQYNWNQPIWHAQAIWSDNPVWTFRPSGSPLSAARLPISRGLYDVRDSSWV
jgi:hypothetical protein